MKTYNLLGTLAVLTTGVVSLSSCETTEPEIVESNYEFTIDKDKVTVDTPDPYNFDTNTYVYVDKSDQIADFRIEASDEGAMVAPPATVQVEVRLSKALKQDVTLSLEVDQKKTEDLLTANPKLKALPSGSITHSPQVTIPAGVQSAMVELTFDDKDLSRYELGKTYAVVLDFSGAEEVKFAKGYNQILAQVTAERPLPKGNNVFADSYLPAGVEKYDSSKITPYSEYQSGRLPVMFDGQTGIWSGNWWVPVASSKTLELNLAEKVRVKAMVFYCRATYYENKSLKSVSVAVSNKGGMTYVDQGTASLDSQENPTVVVFDEAVEIDAIKLSDFMSWGEGYVDIFEIEVYTVTE